MSWKEDIWGVSRKLYETGDGTFTYAELKKANPSNIMEEIEKLAVGEELSLGTSGTVKRIR